MAAMVAGNTEGLARDSKRNPQLAQSHAKCTYGALQPVKNVKPISRVLESIAVRSFDLQS